LTAASQPQEVKSTAPKSAAATAAAATAAAAAAPAAHPTASNKKAPDSEVQVLKRKVRALHLEIGKLREAERLEKKERALKEREKKLKEGERYMAARKKRVDERLKHLMALERDISGIFVGHRLSGCPSSTILNMANLSQVVYPF